MIDLCVNAIIRTILLWRPGAAILMFGPAKACAEIEFVSSMDFGCETDAELSVVNVVADLVRVRAIRVVAS
jgi:hypothetical protein